MDWSVISQDPQIRALVQENALIREFRDALFPRILFRGEAQAIHQPGEAGDSFVFTGNGLMTPTSGPMKPGEDPEPQDFQKEQWTMQFHQYGDRAPDTHMPTSILAIASLLVNNVRTLGLHAAQSLNRAVRNRLYNAGLSGNTVGTGNAGTHTLPVARLNGFTTARRPDLANGEPVKYAAVSSNNPLIVHYKHSGTVYDATVTSFTPDNSGDECGPGTLTVSETVTGQFVSRDPIWTDDHSAVLRPTSLLSIDTMAASTTYAFTFDLFRQAIAQLSDNNVPKCPDGFYHSHFSNYSKNQLYSSDEAQRLQTSLPDYYWYKEFTIGDVLGTLVFEDTETPRKDTLIGGQTNTYTGNLRRGDLFGGESYNATSVEIQRPIFLGAEAVYEYYNDLSGMITEAGVVGAIGDFSNLTNSGVDVNVERVQCYIRAPVNVMGDIVTAVWKMIADWPCRTDGAVGGKARYKRVVVVEHA